MNDRYSRQILFPPVGEKGQRALAESHVLIIGAGALGTASAEGLVRSGIGTLTIVDRDYVEYSNLQRQQLYTELDAKAHVPKAAAAKKRLEQINHEVTIHALIEDADARLLRPLFQKADIVVDATDNFETRMVMNDLSIETKTPWIYGACVSSQGMYMTILPDKTPCLSCVFTAMPVGGLTCDTAGIISPAVQMVSAYQQTEALKYLTGHEEQIEQKFVTFDLWQSSSFKMDISHTKQENCPSCGTNRMYPYLQEQRKKTAVLCGRDTIQIISKDLENFSFQHLKERLSLICEMEVNDFLIHIRYETYRLVFFKGGRVLIHGTNDVKAANSLLARLLGV
ncbi:thiamine biosynthesis protein MoeB [Bacillus australimaris]|uniref:Thiamine biosynthesis protein MoeB n=1 Tax=Bacillus australimaris TaxID=1326968 RepID=A0ABD4QK94_9BACI|nr:thiazole biosynthesis adenylyltransferase ThiF [Bacillus australimaris]KPN13650.1 thiamine biosynthesis protein MoeB [Bacillus australimaris]MBR8690796.1 thiazole biosynthesis adenylyltransferase ThiF [Bacillus australimaris]